MDEFIKKNKTEDKADKEILFEPYNPITKIDNSTITPSDSDPKNLDVQLEIIKQLKKTFKKVYENVDMEQEKAKGRLRYLTTQIFKTKNF